VEDLRSFTDIHARCRGEPHLGRDRAVGETDCTLLLVEDPVDAVEGEAGKALARVFRW
jgi:hypothetical protein